MTLPLKNSLRQGPRGAREKLRALDLVDLELSNLIEGLGTIALVVRSGDQLREAADACRILKRAATVLRAVRRARS